MASRPSVRPPTRTQRRKGGDEDVTAAQASWSILSGNVSVISREFHNLCAMPGGDITEWHIVSGNVPVVSLALWKLRQMKAAAEESERLPGDWTARIDPTTQRTYYYSRSLKKTQWTVPVNEDGSGGSTTKDGSTGVAAGAGSGAGAGAASSGGGTGSASDDATASEPAYIDPLDGKAYDWVEKLDTSSGRTYYFSPLRHKTQWHAPTKMRSGLATKDDWVEKRAPNGRPYYFSPSRNVTTWQKPAGAHTNPTGRTGAEDAKAALNEHGLPGDWRPVLSKSSGKTYYHSKALNKTSWTKPEPESEPAEPAEPAQAAGSATAAVGAPVAAAAPPVPSKPVANADDLADLFGNAAAVAPPPAPARATNGGGAAAGGGVADRVPSFRDPTDPRYVPPEAPPDPDAPPTLTQAEDEAMTTEYDFEGYLMKKGGGKRLFGRRNWQKRYFVMIDAQLAYFKSQEAYEGGQQPLKGAWISVAKYELEEGDDDVSFSLTPKKGEDVERNRGFALRALNDDDRDTWMEKITEAAKYDLLLARQEAEEAARRAEAGEPEYDDDEDDDSEDDDY